MARQSRPFRATVTRYYDQHGRRCTRDTPGATKRTEETETWYAKVGGQKVSLHTTDEGRAWERLRALQRRQAEGQAGIRDEVTDQLSRPINEHIDEWLTHLAHQGTHHDTIGHYRCRVTKLADLAGWKRLGQITADSCTRALAALEVSAQTRNHYLAAAKGFCRWCHPSRMRTLPLLNVRRVNVDADRRRLRRAPTDAEIAALFAYLHSPEAAVRFGMSGVHRALGYRLAMTTGLRGGELRSLTVGSFDLDAGRVTVAAAHSKHRRTDVCELPDWLTAELRQWFAAGGECWSAFPGRDTTRYVLRRDLEAAGVPYAVEGPDGLEYFDFHALRHFFCTKVANLAGISPRTLLSLTRHASADLALKRYAKAQRHDLRTAVEQIGVVGPMVAPADASQQDSPQRYASRRPEQTQEKPRQKSTKRRKKRG